MAGLINTYTQNDPFKQAASETQVQGYAPANAAAQGYVSRDATAQGYKAAATTSRGYGAATAKAETYKAATQGVQKNGLVQNQLTGILNKDSEYMKLAKTRALQAMNGNGTLNSSMAIGAGYAAAMDAALPIAQQDAGTYTQQHLANQQYTNQERSDNAQMGTQVNLANADSQNQARGFTADAANKAEMATSAAINEARQFTAGERNKVGILNAEATNQARQFSAGEENKAAMFNADQQTTANQYQADQQNKTQFMALESSVTEMLAEFDQDRAMALQELKSQYSLDEAMVAANAETWKYTINGISEIMNNTDLTAEQKYEAIGILTEQASANLDYNSAVSGTAGSSTAGGSTTGGATATGAAAGTGQAAATQQAPTNLIEWRNSYASTLDSTAVTRIDTLVGAGLVSQNDAIQWYGQLSGEGQTLYGLNAPLMGSDKVWALNYLSLRPDVIAEAKAKGITDPVQMASLHYSAYGYKEGIANVAPPPSDMKLSLGDSVSWSQYSSRNGEAQFPWQ